MGTLLPTVKNLQKNLTGLKQEQFSQNRMAHKLYKTCLHTQLRPSDPTYSTCHGTQIAFSSLLCLCHKFKKCTA